MAPPSYHITAANARCELPPDLDRENLEQEDHLEIYYEGDMCKIPRLDPRDRPVPGPGEYLVEQVYKVSKHKNKAFKKAGIKVKKTKIMKRGFTRSVFGMFY